jgi:branched-chain amino acid transport system substrate-binding protein
MEDAIRAALGMIGLVLALSGCGPKEPIRIGLIAGLSDRGSDFGESVRNGVILAVEQRNQAGGIHGRMIELIVRDDGQDAVQAARAANELIALKPEIVIGPVTSSMAKIIVPMFDSAGQYLISPTVAATDFRGLDDNLFRVNRTTGEAAEDHANVIFHRGARRVAMAFDTSNLPYSGTWVTAFTQHFEKLGGKVSGSAGFASAASPIFGDVIRDLIATRPDTLVFVASSLDTARLCQQARRQAPDLPLSSTEWAASGELLAEMGGDAVEGLLIAHAYDRDDQRTPFTAFRTSFKARFQREFGSFSLLAFDTANIVFTALEKRQPNEDMKSALLKYSPYQGVQQEIRFDPNGDTTRKVSFTEIRRGQFIQIR